MTPERFALLKATLARRQPDLTVLMENVHKPHNYSAVLRSCDAVGALDAHAITSSASAWKLPQKKGKRRGGRRRRSHHPSEAAASAAKWVRVTIHTDVGAAVETLRAQGMAVFAAHRSERSVDFRAVDYTQPTAILVGAELDGVTPQAAALADDHITVPMIGLVESLNVSVAAAVILFEAQRQRAAKGMYRANRLDSEAFRERLFEWAYPEIAAICRSKGAPYPPLDDDGHIAGPLPR